MKHVFSVQFEISLKFSTELPDISDYIFKKEGTAKFFGNKPIMTPDKNAFFLANEGKNTLSLVSLPNVPDVNIPNGIVLSVEHNYNSENYTDIVNLFIDYVEYIKNKLKINAKKIGSVFLYEDKSLENSFDILKRYVKPSLDDDALDDDSFHGGNFRFLYKKRLKKECPVNLVITLSTESEKNIKILVDVNSDNIDSISSDLIKEISMYSNEFANNRLRRLIQI